MIVSDVSEVHAQNRTPLITTSIGFIRNLQEDSSQPHFAVYPEIQFNWSITDGLWGRLVVDGSAYAGGFREVGIDQTGYSHVHFFGDAYSSLITGGRLNFMLKKSPQFFWLFSGFSRHFVWTQAIGPSNGSFTDAFSAVEAGLRIQMPLGRKLLIGGTAKKYWDISNSAFDIERRFAYTLDVSYVRR